MSEVKLNWYYKSKIKVDGMKYEWNQSFMPQPNQFHSISFHCSLRMGNEIKDWIEIEGHCGKRVKKSKPTTNWLLAFHAQPQSMVVELFALLPRFAWGAIHSLHSCRVCSIPEKITFLPFLNSLSSFRSFILFVVVVEWNGEKSCLGSPALSTLWVEAAVVGYRFASLALSLLSPSIQLYSFFN